ncbi:hypothetical protein [Megalodesulfovibrio gigas]|uniref:DUF5610 domain-containing protein n=1 Tax=Megalodesulfovibrio gigas (strain ATCC 19364 / DSM 1382 / NCIMB 9332 / VKM B-1759) TaxID=1121448 RepID=T2GA63_MEGG1|nr:hypothetical protein [Megalodesulfovibrio gigas]AGW13016.1 hypothetical protein DGI_1153 [Megalodesulfovibrio gigas DSM 1382 = ATCC 19364]
MELTGLAGGYSAFTLGSATSNARFGTLSSPGSQSGLGETFGQAVVLQLQSTLGKDDAQAGSLATALGESMDSLRAQFGDQTAQAAMAMVAKRLDQPAEGTPLTEEQFSRGLLEAVRLVDKSYGFAAGDEVMRQFNGDLNDAINAYFDNGLKERFFATAVGEAQDAAATPLTVSASQMQTAQQEAAASPTESLLEAMREDLEAFLADPPSDMDDPTAAALQSGAAQYAALAASAGGVSSTLSMMV